MNFNKGKYGDFLVSSTDSLENYQILQYFDMVSSRIVVGAGFLTEFFAGFTDTFGGRSESVENRLNELYSSAVNELVEKAKKLSANAVIGVKVDIDEISGKGTFMFMISALGTPVFAKRNEGFPLLDELVEQEMAIKRAAERKVQQEAAEKAKQEAIEKAHQVAAYWKEHQEEKASLEQEKALLEQEKTNIQARLDDFHSHLNNQEQNNIAKQINSLYQEIASLGWRNGKEKQSLESQISSLREKSIQLANQMETENIELKKRRDLLTERLIKINFKLSNPF